LRRQATHRWSAAELLVIVAAERAGTPFLVWRDSVGSQQLFALAGRSHVTVGRRSTNDVVLSDGEVSRTHAVLELLGSDWTVADDGLSRNGTYLRDARVTQVRRLADGDMLRIGQTIVEYHRPGQGESAVTAVGAATAGKERLSDTQRRILTALCRPCLDGGRLARPATNAEIADEVFLGIDAVKKQLRSLYARFGLVELPQNQKRARLAQHAIEQGFVSRHP
jgi:DNA-binding CsgD family transcriptional regulator